MNLERRNLENGLRVQRLVFFLFFYLLLLIMATCQLDLLSCIDYALIIDLTDKSELFRIWRMKWRRPS